MNTELTQLKLSSGGTVWIEAQEVPGEVRAGMGDTVTKTFEEAFKGVQPAIEGLLGQLKALQVKGGEVKFGLVIGTEANAWIAKATGQANFEITVHWSN
jgi:hypothetical protein